MSPQEKLIRFIDPMTATALIGAGASVAGGVINGVGSIFTKKKDRKFAHDEAALARQHAEEMYNKYASPAAQRQQMLESGLNPMGAISPQSVGTSSSQASTPSGSAPDFGSALTGGFAGYVQGKQLAMQMKTQKLANDIAAEDLKTKQLDNQMKAIDANNYDEYKKITIEMLQHDRDFKKLTKEEQDLKIQQMYEASQNGWNPYTNEQRAADDAHGASEDAHRAADDAHSAHVSAENRAKELHELNKSLINHQISAQEYANIISKSESDFSVVKSFVRSKLNVNYDDLYPWMKPLVINIANYESMLDSFDVSTLEPGTDRWFKYNQFVSALADLKADFFHDIEWFSIREGYEASYENQRHIDASETIRVAHDNWNMQEGQRDTDNYYKKLTTISQIAGALFK